MYGISVAGKGIISPESRGNVVLAVRRARRAAETGTKRDHTRILSVAHLNGHVGFPFSHAGQPV